MDKKFRKEFKILDDGKIIYFDNSASTLKPKCVVSAVNYYNEFEPMNVGRGVYKLAYEVTKKVNDTRVAIAKLIGSGDNEIIFTKNTTEGLNLVAKCFAGKNLKKDDEIIISAIEHHSNYLPWIEIAKEIGAKIVNIPLTKEGRITVENFKSVLSEKTKLVAITFVSNVLGYKTPIIEITKLAHEKNAIVVVDAAQAVSHFAFNVKNIDCDFLAFSGYKMFGPSGVGILFGKEKLLNSMRPYNFGGGMVLEVENDNITYKDTPEKFEGGTLPVGSIIGLGQAAVFIKKIGYNYIEKKDIELKNYMLKKLSEIKNVEIYNPKADIAIIAFNIKGVHAHDAATMYDEDGICIRAGNHCAQPLVKFLGQISTIRASLAFYNTFEEIDRFINSTKKIIKFFGKFNQENND